MWFFESVLVVLFIAIITFFAGQPLLLALTKQNRFLTIEKFCLSLLYGTITISFLYSIGSYLNLPGKYFGQSIILAIIISTFLLRKQVSIRIYETKKFSQWLLTFFLTIFVSLLTLFLYNSFTPFNDTIGYISVSDYLYNHGFLKKYTQQNGFQPLDQLILIFQGTRTRMGGCFFSAAIQSMLGIKKSIVIFPALQTWGIILNLASITIAARWIFHLGWKYIFFVLLLVSITFNPLYYSVHYGFYHQTYACAFLLLTLAAFTRLIQNGTNINKKKYTVITAIFSAALIFYYPELVPFAFLALMLSGLAPFFRNKQNKLSWFYTLSSLTLVSILIANINFVGTLLYLSSQVKGVFGWHIGFRLHDYINSALGFMPIGPNNTASNVLGMFFTLLFIYSIHKLTKSNFLRYCAWLSCIFVFIAVFVYFRFFVRNPWTHELGQSWSLFKLINWVYPIAILGIGFALSQLRWNNIVYVFLIVTCIPIAIKTHPYYFNQALLANTFTKSNHPFDAYKQFASTVKNLKTDLPIQLNTGQNKIFAYYLSPKPVIADWREDGYMGGLKPEYKNIQINKKHFVIIETEKVLTDKAIALPAGTALIDSTMPYIKNYTDFYALETLGKSSWRWSSGTSSVNFHYDKNEKAKIQFKIRFLKAPAKLLVKVNNKTEVISIHNNEFNSVEIKSNLNKGDNIIYLHTETKPIKVGDDPRLLIFSLSNLKISPENNFSATK